MVINDNKESVTCRICGEQCKRIYGRHLKHSHNNMSTDEYKRLFPGAPITALSDKEKTSKNSGLHMKDEKYKKMFSEMFKGDKNPNHISNTTDEQRRSRSPFSKSFVGYDMIEDKEEHISKFAKDAIKDRVSDTTLRYYLNRGYTVEVAKQMLSERQTTFSLEKCIEKYGDEIGHKRWLDRQNKWQTSLLENGNIKCGFSKISQELFFEILKRYNTEDISEVYYATKNKEYYISIKDVGFFAYDFTDLKRKLIIEYNGDLYHANPDIYESTDYPHPYYKEDGPTAGEIWSRDNNKIDVAREKGFDVLTIWDSEYKSDKNKTINKCLDFLGI